MASNTRKIIDLIRKIFADIRLQIVSLAVQNEATISLLSQFATIPSQPSIYKGWKGFVNSCFFCQYYRIR